MSQAGYTPISLYYSTTASATPTSGNLTNGELAINIQDEKLYFKNAAGTVKVLAGAGGTGIVAGSNTQIQFNSSGSFGASSLFTFDGTTFNAPNSVITSSSSSAALRITQTGSGNALLVEDSANPDSTPFVVDTNGNIASGITNPSTYLGSGGGFILKSTTAYAPQIWLWNSVNDVSAGYYIFRKDRAGAIVQNGDGLGNIHIQGYDGTNYLRAAEITVSVDGTPGTNDMPGRLVFSTTADGASLPTERLRIASTGAFGLSGANYGTSGQVLTSAGSGSAPTWAAASSSQWTTTGSDIYYSTGNVGFGVAPTATSSTGIIQNQGGILWAYSNLFQDLTQNAYYNGGYKYSVTSYAATMYRQQGGSHIWFNSPTGTAGNAITFSEAMRMDSSSSFGIGNTSPSSSATRFAVQRPTTPTGTLPIVQMDLGWDNQGSQDNAGIRLQYGGGGVPNGSLLTARIGNNTSFNLNNSGTDNNIYGAGGRPPVYVYSGPSGSYNSYGQPPVTNAFAGGGTVPRTAIFSEMSGMYDGSALVGQSIRLAGSYGGNSVRDVYCSAVQATTAFGSDRGYGTSYGYYANVSSNITANYAFYAAAGDAAKPGGGSWTSTSDSRVKNVLGQYARGLNDVLKINVVDFEYNGKGGHVADGRRYTGVIAQEMQEIFPEMVRTHRTKLEEADAEDTNLLMVDNSALVYALVNAIKELKADFDAYKASHP